MFLEFWSQASRDPEVWKATIAPYRRYQTIFAGLIQEGIDEGTLRPIDPRTGAQVIVSLAVGLFLQGLLDPQGADWKQVARDSFQSLVGGVAREGRMILVTGGTGHIGNVLVRELLAKGEKVRVLVLPGDNLSPLEGLDFERLEGDILDLKSLKRAFSGVSAVYHLAGMITIMPGKNEQLFQVNVQGTRNVVQACLEAGVQRLVYTSSIHAIARTPHGVVIDESVPFDPESTLGVYDRSKSMATLAVLDAVKQGLDAVIVCPTGVIGPYDFRHSEMGTLIYSCVNSKVQFCIQGAYDFVDVRDVARGMILACENGHKGESYILSGERITIKSVIDTVGEVTGTALACLNVPLWMARGVAFVAPTFYRLTRRKPHLTPYSLHTVTGNSVISREKARRELGYDPRSIRESIADTVRWFVESRKKAKSAE